MAELLTTLLLRQPTQPRARRTQALEHSYSTDRTQPRNLCTRRSLRQ